MTNNQFVFTTCILPKHFCPLPNLSLLVSPFVILVNVILLSLTCNLWYVRSPHSKGGFPLSATTPRRIPLQSILYCGTVPYDLRRVRFFINLSSSVGSGSYCTCAIGGLRIFGNTRATSYTHYRTVWTVRGSVVVPRALAVRK